MDTIPLEQQSIRLFTDGGAQPNPGPAASAFVLVDEQDHVVDSAGQSIGDATNNVAEYMGLIFGLQACLKHGYKKVQSYMDSQLIIKQMNGEYRVKDARMKQLHQHAKDLAAQFSSVEFHWIPRKQNRIADALCDQVLLDR